MAYLTRKKIKKDYFYEILTRKTYSIKSVDRNEATKFMNEIKQVNNKVIENIKISDEVDLVEDVVIKTRILSKSQNTITKGKGLSGRIPWH